MGIDEGRVSDVQARMRGRELIAALNNRLHGVAGRDLDRFIAALEALAEPDGTPEQGAALLAFAHPPRLALVARA